jgi:hypothetical protein
MPNKHNAPRRHHIPKMTFRVKNWAEYDAGLRRRGSLTLWVTPEVLDGWRAARRTTLVLLCYKVDTLDLISLAEEIVG